ncbi:MAG TPA: AAA family ATPase, partial [Bacteroidia bacterium]|nr:AAA family ATPase [Bacteroidia bacterium]
MIKSVRLQNFFSFEDETIELHPEANVFVGINGSGKSNVLKAFKLLQEGMAGRLRQLILDQWGGFDAMRFKGDRSTTPIVLTFNLDPSAMGKKESHELNYQIMLRNVSDGTNFSLIENLFTVGIEENDPRYYLAFLNGKGKYWNYSKNFERWDVDEYDLGDGRNLALSMISPSTDRSYINLIRDKLRNLHVYEHFDTAIGSKIRRPVIATSEKRLIDDGSNLSQMLNTIKINDKDNHARLINQLKAVNDQFTGIDFNFLGGNIELMLEESKFKSSVHVTHISDGTL